MPGPHYADDLVTLHLGDCIDIMAGMPDASVDAVVTDPPYGLEFMGREWDTFKQAPRRVAGTGGSEAPFAHHAAELSPARNRAFQSWCEAWSAECFRILKPGGHLLAFGGTRTYHRLACAVEDAGFEIRDSLHWLYGSGFPKSLDVSKAIDKAAGVEREDKFGGALTRFAGPTGNKKCDTCGKWLVSGSPCKCPRPQDAAVTSDAARWSGWGTALKPSHEPIVVARKPLAGTVAGNVLEWGTGALNVDGCRVEGVPPSVPQWQSAGSNNNWAADGRNGAMSQPNGAGRWPPNVLLTHSADCNGTCAPGCPVAGLDAQSGVSTATGGRISGSTALGQGSGWNAHSNRTTEIIRIGDTGGASRFFPCFRYQAKAPKSERPRLDNGTAWPTVKPLDLMRWLVRLVVPPGGIVLDPFAGTGTTGEAAALEGFNCILIEQDPVAIELALQRLRKANQPDLFTQVGGLHVDSSVCRFPSGSEEG